MDLPGDALGISHTWGWFAFICCVFVPVSFLSPNENLMVQYLFSSERVTGQSVTQTLSHLTIKEGAAVFINCTYQYSGVPTLFWYIQQTRSEGPQLLLTESTGKGRKDGFFAGHIKATKSFHLQKEAGSLSDSVTYFCALRDTVRETSGRAT